MISLVKMTPDTKIILDLDILINHLANPQHLRHPMSAMAREEQTILKVTGINKPNEIKL